jgi:hypothetical protein
MKPTFARFLAYAAAATLATSIATAQTVNKGCTNATLLGTFAYTVAGSITAPPALAGPFASVGTQTFDGRGGFTAVATVSQNGMIVPVTIKRDLHGESGLHRHVYGRDLTRGHHQPHLLCNR